MKLKSILATVLSLCMVCTLAACGNTDQKEQETDNENTSKMQVQKQATKPPEYIVLKESVTYEADGTKTSTTTV